MNDGHIEEIISILGGELEKRELPIVSHLAKEKRNPFVILISTLLSLRTKDEVTSEATKRLFSLASTPQEMLQLSPEIIAKTIYPVGFYKNKAKTILAACRELIDRYNSLVPDTMEQLLAMKGVGRKTANLVLTLGFNKEGICVDTHVHRISNRLGYVRTGAPEQTEFALREKLPHKYWLDYNTLLVAFGRHVCRPVSPFCGSCPVSNYCDRVGVTKSR
ncbi:MAG TPA: endonuclease III [Syntrophales bacterium]|nr:endonuclease III [Syntrophales bacterium]